MVTCRAARASGESVVVPIEVYSIVNIPPFPTDSQIENRTSYVLNKGKL